MPIIKTPYGWKISNTHGVSPTREAALKRLRAIKASQGAKMSDEKKGVNIGEYSKDITRFYGIPGANAGKKNGMYRHGRWSTVNKPKKTKCANCGSKSNLLYHHINHNEADNNISNIRILCKTCHERHHERGNNFTGKKSKNASTKRVKNGKAYR